MTGLPGKENLEMPGSSQPDFSLQHDGFRYKQDALQGFTDEWHTRDYRALGYRIIRVPVLPPEERLVFVLEVLVERGLMPQ